MDKTFIQYRLFLSSVLRRILLNEYKWQPQNPIDPAAFVVQLEAAVHSLSGGVMTTG